MSTDTARRWRARWVLPAIGLVAACTTACGAPGTAVPATRVGAPVITTVTVVPDRSTTTPPGATTSEAPPSTSSSPPTSGPPTSVFPIVPDDGAGRPPTCPLSSLSVTLGPGEGTTSGTVYRPLVFTNTGTSTCRLRGFPGVSHVAGDDGHQVGRAGAWVGSRGDAVDLAPAASAHSTISVTDTDLIDRDVCDPVEVRGYRVYPPASDGAAYVPSPGLSCPGDISTIRVRTLLPGRGDLSGEAGVVAPDCTTRSLSVGLGEAEGAAGSRYQPLVFTNTGSSVCAMRGFPGVSQVAGDDGHQVGPEAAEVGEPGGRIELAPGDSAHATVRTSDPGVVGADRCEPTDVRGLRVYPPGEDTAAYVPRPRTGCAGDVTTLRVRGVRPDAD